VIAALPFWHHPTRNGPPAFAAHHVAFARRLGGVRRVAGSCTPVARILRRIMNLHVQHLSWAIQVALRLMDRVSMVNHAAIRTAVHHNEMRQHRVEIIRHMLERQRVLESRVREQREVPRSGEGLLNQIGIRERVQRRIVIPKIAMTLSKPRQTDPSKTLAANQVEMQTDLARHVGRVSDPIRNGKRTAMVLPEQELSRVTDHVIRQLDRRVLSYCERTGRV